MYVTTVHTYISLKWIVFFIFIFNHSHRDILLFASVLWYERFCLVINHENFWSRILNSAKAVQQISWKFVKRFLYLLSMTTYHRHVTHVTPKWDNQCFWERISFLTKFLMLSWNWTHKCEDGARWSKHLVHIWIQLESKIYVKIQLTLRIDIGRLSVDDLDSKYDSRFVQIFDLWAIW